MTERRLKANISKNCLRDGARSVSIMLNSDLTRELPIDAIIKAKREEIMNVVNTLKPHCRIKILKISVRLAPSERKIDRFLFCWCIVVAR